MKARAVRFLAPRSVAVEDVHLDDPTGDELLVRTVYSGISAGTELLAYRGELDAETPLDETLAAFEGGFHYPFGYGYSAVGRTPDGTAVFAFHPHQSHFTAPAADVLPLPDGLDPRLATMFPLVETALQLSLDAGPVLGETVLVTGLGAVGLLTSLLLTRAGAEVVALEPQQWRRSLAGSVGITARHPDESDARAALLVETSGAPRALADGLGRLRHEGTALVGSWYGTKPVSLPLGGDFHRRRLTIRSSQVSTIPAAQQDRWTRDRRRATALALMPGLPLAALATTEFAFENAPAAYEALDRGAPGVLHAALRYE
ncbi:zinc-dependent alcohol dehydrogenase [Catenuloplanes atrovinosus]|uniref:Threonine dehydrogenase-like Zn-dependent dehydrogenase n=1 Tax=Catenuloplanes atrovinosus TaxID=137266 RepID=A0AAE3YQ90_9ACTN|nr:zinc-binding alcohol dehydrogenase [Catenuloplanes atrovinosus]MDR7276655.1 threonine dehydrogenase-like Zn-dependent dehydrogenase [Catenuloplanes atrovinosus]